MPSHGAIINWTRKARWLVVLFGLLLWPPMGWAQQQDQQDQQNPQQQEEVPPDQQQNPEDPTAVADQQPVVTEPFFRFGFYEWTTQRFSGEHPFYLMTGNQYFKDGNTSVNSTQDNTGLFISGDEQHDQDKGLWTQIWHGLPPLSIDYVIPLNYEWFKAISFGYYNTNTWLTDQTAAVEAPRRSAVPVIELRSHYYFFHSSLHFLQSPGPDSTEIIYGIGWAHIESTIRNGFRGHGTKIEGLSESFIDLDSTNSEKPVFFQRVAMLSNGQNWGIGLELYLLAKTPVIENPFWKSRLIATEPLREDIHLQGLIFRLNWLVYNGW